MSPRSFRGLKDSGRSKTKTVKAKVRRHSIPIPVTHRPTDPVINAKKKKEKVFYIVETVAKHSYHKTPRRLSPSRIEQYNHLPPKTISLGTQRNQTMRRTYRWMRNLLFPRKKNAGRGGTTTSRLLRGGSLPLALRLNIL